MGTSWGHKLFSMRITSINQRFSPVTIKLNDVDNTCEISNWVKSWWTFRASWTPTPLRWSVSWRWTALRPCLPGTPTWTPRTWLQNNTNNESRGASATHLSCKDRCVGDMNTHSSHDAHMPDKYNYHVWCCFGCCSTCLSALQVR